MSEITVTAYRDPILPTYQTVITLERGQDTLMKFELIMGGSPFRLLAQHKAFHAAFGELREKLEKAQQTRK